VPNPKAISIFIFRVNMVEYYCTLNLPLIKSMFAQITKARAKLFARTEILSFFHQTQKNEANYNCAPKRRISSATQPPAKKTTPEPLSQLAEVAMEVEELVTTDSKRARSQGPTTVHGKTPPCDSCFNKDTVGRKGCKVCFRRCLCGASFPSGDPGKNQFKNH
jgi:hypothetical protein